MKDPCHAQAADPYYVSHAAVPGCLPGIHAADTTLTAVFLASSARADPTETPRAERSTALVSASPTMTPILRQTVRPPRLLPGSASWRWACGQRWCYTPSRASRPVVATLPGSQVTSAAGAQPGWPLAARGLRRCSPACVACPERCQAVGPSRRSASDRAGSVDRGRPRRLLRQPRLQPGALRAASQDACSPIRSMCAAALGWIKP